MSTEINAQSKTVTIECLETNIDHDRAALIVEKYAGDHAVQVQKLIYYPYFWVFFNYSVKTLIGKSRIIKASCMVDLINNHAATTDSFESVKKDVPSENILEADFTAEQAFETAKTYLTHAAIHKMKALLVPDYEVVDKKTIYKPFWIVRCSNTDLHKFKVIVDGVTGKYQLL